MTPPLSPQRSAELQELVRELGAQMRATTQVVRVELIRRGWTDAEIAAALTDRTDAPPCP
jgi:NADPH-dependent 2,4-dienoyl-CoA reductase/sulfur reductase-like enzyme